MDERHEPSRRVPFYMPSSPVPIAIVAQSPGATEVKRGAPLVGASGELLADCFAKAGLPWVRCLRTNVVGYQPPGNDFGFFCSDKKSLPKDYIYPAVNKSQYLKPEWLPELDRLRRELEHYKPNLVIACGNEALWALTKLTGISKYQGAIVESTLVPGLKVLPIYHPAAALREYTLKVYITQALFKAKREAEYPEIRYTKRELWIYPELLDLLAWHEKEKIHYEHTKMLSVDLESPSGHIDCIGFSFRPECALVVPFYSDLRPGKSYWRTQHDEEQAWNFVEFMLETYDVLGQNYQNFDAWKLLVDIGIPTRRFRHCLMTAHHAYQPELDKDLGTLTAIYCNDPAYKNYRPRGNKDVKRDE